MNNINKNHDAGKMYYFRALKSEVGSKFIVSVFIEIIAILSIVVMCATGIMSKHNKISIVALFLLILSGLVVYGTWSLFSYLAIEVRCIFKDIDKFNNKIKDKATRIEYFSNYMLACKYNDSSSLDECITNLYSMLNCIDFDYSITGKQAEALIDALSNMKSNGTARTHDIAAVLGYIDYTSRHCSKEARDKLNNSVVARLNYGRA